MPEIQLPTYTQVENINNKIDDFVIDGITSFYDTPNTIKTSALTSLYKIEGSGVISGFSVGAQATSSDNAQIIIKVDNTTIIDVSLNPSASTHQYKIVSDVRNDAVGTAVINKFPYSIVFGTTKSTTELIHLIAPIKFHSSFEILVKHPWAAPVNNLVKGAIV